MSNSWDRQRDENGELEPMLWFGRFDKYRAQGPSRSVSSCYREWRDRKGYEKLRYSGYPKSWAQAYHRWNWKERAEAWDEHQRQLDFIAEQEAHDEMRRRHADLGMALQGVGAKALRRFQDSPDELDPSDARMSIKDGIGIERTARGLPVELVALYSMSDEELLKENERINQALGGINPSQAGDRSDHAGEGADTDAAD